MKGNGARHAGSVFLHAGMEHLSKIRRAKCALTLFSVVYAECVSMPVLIKQEDGLGDC